MSYEVTATRRRPQRFEDLAGQEFVAETFKNSIQSGKIAHAYLFSGPRGCGKTSTARILAKSLSCANGPTATPCGHCQQCMEITKGTCTDVIEIDGASNTSVNDVRQIKDEILFPPQSCRYKIYIIDEVHMLSMPAFNALLKTIEEPPPYVIFIFATTELQKVPATIKSRCQQFNFRLIPIEKVKEQLAEAAKEINIAADDEALYWIARESTGSMRDAYTLFDQVAAFSGDKITYDKIRDKLGLVGVDRLNEIFEDCAQNKSQDALQKLDTYLQAGISIEQLISNSTDYLRSLLLIKNGIQKEALLGQSAGRYSQIVLERWNSIQIERAVSLFLQLYRDIRYSLNPRYELELAFSRLSWLSDYVSPVEVKAAIDKARALLEGAPSQNRPASQGAAPVNNLQGHPAQSQRQSPQGSSAPRPQFFSNELNRTPQGQEPSAGPSPAVPPEQSAPQTTVPEQNQGQPPAFNLGGAEPPEQAAVSQYSYAPEGEMPPDDFLNSEPAPQIEPVITAPTGDMHNMDNLKKAVISDLSLKDNEILAATLMQTSAWSLTENRIYATVTAEFTRTTIQKQTALINRTICALYGSPLTFVVEVKQQKPKEQVVDSPKEVQLLCSVFKGQIVSHTETINAPSTPAPQPGQTEANSTESDTSDDTQETEELNSEEDDE
ncbi:MAG: DNA polymerase III subunit gamma/tau [Treponema sp.]|nr:DNA polymerase III subunit gamma/tau [Treponema sp.]